MYIIQMRDGNVNVISGDRLDIFLEELGVEMPEYERLCSKWARVIEQYKKENSNV